MAKVKADGTALVYLGYIGGSGDDVGQGIAVDRRATPMSPGSPTPTESTFPVTVGPDLTFNGGDQTPSWPRSRPTAPRSSTAATSAARGDDAANGIAVDGAGNAYVTGRHRLRPRPRFPVTVGPDLTFNGGLRRLRGQGQRRRHGLVYAGYIGGSGDDRARDRRGQPGNAYVTGLTTSTETTLPVTVGPDLTFNGGTIDAFVAKVKADGTALVYAGYIGGSGDDEGNGIAVDAAGNAYVTGDTDPTETTSR